MGNIVLSQCRTGISDQNDNNYLPTMSELSRINTLNKKIIKNPQQNTLKAQNQQKQSQNKTVPQSLITLPVRSPQIQAIYESLIKQRPVQYSIQRQQYLTHLNISFFQQLKQKLINNLGKKNVKLSDKQNETSDRVDKKDTQTNKISLSSTQVKKILIQQAFNNLKIIPYKLISQNTHDISIDKYAYRERSLSKSFDIDQYEKIEKQIQQNKYKDTPSLYDYRDFQIHDKGYVYIGHVNSQNIPHGSGQLYSIQFMNQNHQKSNQQSMFIQAEFNNGSIVTDDALIINQNGSFYRGGYVGDTIHEKGILHQKDGLILQGKFVNGLLQGKAKVTYPDLGSYQGTFHQGLRDGKGIMTWKSQQINTLTNTPLTITYDGYFKQDKMQGLGYLKTPNYQYWGPFVSNMKQGKGTLKFNDGRKYQGWFQKDEISGYGQLHYPDGFVQKGIFPLTNNQ